MKKLKLNKIINENTQDCFSMLIHRGVSTLEKG